MFSVFLCASIPRVCGFMSAASYVRFRINVASFHAWSSPSFFFLPRLLEKHALSGFVDCPVILCVVSHGGYGNVQNSFLVHLFRYGKFPCLGHGNFFSSGAAYNTETFIPLLVFTKMRKPYFGKKAKHALVGNINKTLEQTRKQKHNYSAYCTDWVDYALKKLDCPLNNVD